MKLSVQLFFFVPTILCALTSLNATTATRHGKATTNTDANVATKHINLHRKQVRSQRSAPEVVFSEDEAQSRTAQLTRYLQASFLHAKGNAQESFKSYQHLLAQNPSPYIFGGFFRLLFDVGQFKSIVTLYEKKQAEFEKAFKDSLDFQLIVAQAYLNTEQEAKAEKLFSALAEKYPDNEQVAYYTALTFIQNNQLDKALEFIDDCLEKPILHTKYFLFYFLKSKIHLQQHNPTKALAMIEKSIEAYPKFDRGWLFKSILLEQQGKVNDAITGYKKFLDLVGSEETIEKQLVQLLFSQQRYSEAAHYLKKMKRYTPEFHFDLALIEFKAGSYPSALAHVNTCLDKSPNFKQAHLLKIDILLAQKNTRAALSFLRDWLIKNPQDNLIVHTLLLLRNAGVQRSELIATLEEVNKACTPTLGMLSALADLCVENGDHKQGITYYHSIFNLTHDAKLKAQILYHIAYILFSTKNYHNLENFISKALKSQHTSSNLYNLIAFYYVQTNQKLDLALEYVDKALASDPQSAYYLDTKGLVLIKMGKKEEAIDILKQALNLSPNDSEILKHIALARE